MRKHAKRTFVAFIFMSLFLTIAVPTLAFPYAITVFDRGTYVGCEIGDTSARQDARVYNMSEFDCILYGLFLAGRSGGTIYTPPPGGDKNSAGTFESTLFSVDPRQVEHVQISLKDQKIESINVEKEVADWELYDKLTVLRPEKALAVIRDAKIDGATSCTLKGPGGVESGPLIKIPDTDKNRGILKQAGVPYIVFKRSDVVGKILALGPLSAVRNVMNKERIKFKETP